jgi:hypothetical protein
MPLIKLRKPDVNHFSIADHVEYNVKTYSICYKYATTINVPELITGYESKIRQEESIYKWNRRSDYTAKKAKADNARDIVYTGITSLVRTNLKHFDPSIRDNAAHVYNLLENYGDLTNASYDAKTAGIDSVVTKLNSADYLPAVQVLGLTPWLVELANRNNLFKSYVDDTTQEQINKPEISFSQARRETNEALRRIINRVTSLIDFNGPDTYADFVEEFNVVTNHYNTLVREHYGRLHAKIDIAPANIAPIDVQQYTGKPIYVIPTVTLRKVNNDGSETVIELVFSEDFTVAYKNNVNPGTATLIIKGIGKYAGEITTTFNIE